MTEEAILEIESLYDTSIYSWLNENRHIGIPLSVNHERGTYSVLMGGEVITCSFNFARFFNKIS